MIAYPLNWRSEGACLAADPDLFFPAAADAEAAQETARARRICAGCPVKRQCLDYAMQTGEPTGIWGGTTPQERNAVLRHRTRRTGRGGAVRRVSPGTLVA